MAYIGPWGQFIHIPKCAGLSMRAYLSHKWQDGGYEENGMHDLPDEIDNAFTIIRHPANLLVSFYHYYQESYWHWEDLPKEVDDLFNFANGLFWPQYVEAITTRNPGAVGKMFDYYCRPGVKVYHLEDIDKNFPGIRKVHPSGDKPLMTDAQWDMICRAEAYTLEKYGYAHDDNR